MRDFDILHQSVEPISNVWMIWMSNYKGTIIFRNWEVNTFSLVHHDYMFIIHQHDTIQWNNEPTNHSAYFSLNFRLFESDLIKFSRKSLIKIENKSSPKTEPWGAPNSNYVCRMKNYVFWRMQLYLHLQYTCRDKIFIRFNTLTTSCSKTGWKKSCFSVYVKWYMKWRVH